MAGALGRVVSSPFTCVGNPEAGVTPAVQPAALKTRGPPRASKWGTLAASNERIGTRRPSSEQGQTCGSAFDCGGPECRRGLHGKRSLRLPLVRLATLLCQDGAALDRRIPGATSDVVIAPAVLTLTHPPRVVRVPGSGYAGPLRPGREGGVFLSASRRPSHARPPLARHASNCRLAEAGEPPDDVPWDEEGSFQPSPARDREGREMHPVRLAASPAGARVLASRP